MPTPSKIIYHPLLISLYPVLVVYSGNVAKVSPSDLLGPTLVVLAVGVAIWVVAGLVFRSVAKSALVASLSVVVFFLYGHFYDAFIKVCLVGHYYTLFPWLVLYVGGMALIAILKRDSANHISRVLNAFSLVLVLLTCIPIAKHGLQMGYAVNHMDNQALQDKDNVSDWSRPSEKLVDVYFIFLDGYGREDKLKEFYGFDNTPFLAGLKAKGFHVASRSTCNYTNTFQSMSATLDMDYPSSDSQSPPIENCRVVRLMHALGYRFVLIPSLYFPMNDYANADLTVDLGTSPPSELAVNVWNASLARFIVYPMPIRRAIFLGGGLDIDGCAQFHAHITRQMEALGDAARIEGRKFVFAHVNCPHPPFIFQRDGSLRIEAEAIDFEDNRSNNVWSLREQFVDQTIHLNRLINVMVDKILENSKTPPIIILAGDHGTFASNTRDTLNALPTPSPAHVRERMAILFACYAPDAIHHRLYDTISLVNVFRIVFNEQFGANYPLRDDRNFWSFTTPAPEVTSLVDPPRNEPTETTTDKRR